MKAGEMECVPLAGAGGELGCSSGLGSVLGCLPCSAPACCPHQVSNRRPQAPQGSDGTDEFRGNQSSLSAGDPPAGEGYPG